MLSKLNLVLISVIEATYVLFFLNFFKTKKSLDQGYILNKLQKLGISKKSLLHPTYESPYPISMICPFGHFISIPIAIYLIVRFLLPFNLKTIVILNIIVTTMIFIGSFMNFNAVVYLLPFVIGEIVLNLYLIKSNK